MGIVGIDNVSEERERLLQMYDELIGEVGSRGEIPFRLRREYRDLQEAYKRYNHAPHEVHEVHVASNDRIYRYAANRIFSGKLDEFRRKLTGEKK